MSPISTEKKKNSNLIGALASLTRSTCVAHKRSSSIATRRILAAGYAAIPCELDGAGEHGYAWMIDKPNDWKARPGVNELIQVPQKPKRVMSADMAEQYVYMLKMNEYKVYNHLVQEGRNTIIEWFGKAMFLDLYVDRQLPIDKTPRDLLEYLASTYATPRTNRQYMENVRKAFNAPYDHKQPVESYFMKLQEVRDSARILGEPYSDQQLANKAIAQFERALGKDTVRKMETRWYETPDTQQTWADFKVFWKEEIHLYQRLDGTGNKATKAAHQAMVMEDLQSQIVHLKEENRSLVAGQISIGKTLQQDQYSSHGSSDDDNPSS